jgi:hypothetical protein
VQRRCGIEYGEHLRTQRGAVVVALGEHTPLRLRCQCEAYFTPENRNNAGMFDPAVLRKASNRSPLFRRRTGIRSLLALGSGIRPIRMNIGDALLASGTEARLIG